MHIGCVGLNMFYSKEKDWVWHKAWQTDKPLHTHTLVVLCYRYDTSLSQVCTALAQKWVSAADDELHTLTVDTAPDVAQSAYLLKEFLAQLLEEVSRLVLS